MPNISPFPACHPDDEGFVHQKLSRFPRQFRGPIAKRYSARYNQGDKEARFEANTKLRITVDQLPKLTYSLAADNSELVEFARARAIGFRNTALTLKGDEKRYRVLADRCKMFNIKPPDPIGSKNVSMGSAVARMCDEHWWRRAIRKSHGRALEKTARELGLVNKSSGIYSSNETLYRRRGQKSRNRRMLEEVVAVNELGDEFSLAELSDLSTSNPTIRRGELMLRIAGFETVADEINHVGEFITLTCPSRMHSHTLRNNGWAVENRKFDGTTPREAQKYLSKVWARVRAKLARHNIKLYGFRVAEPNHDGCPHWHLLVFIPSWARRRVRHTFKRYGLEDSPNESGAKEHRVTFKTIDKSKGTAAGYIAKYVAKNIDGFALDADTYGTNPIEGAERVDAWAACWGIRQFQQLGGPPVSVWRELRRIDWEETGNLGEIINAADSGNWAHYVQLMGGPLAARETMPIRISTMQEIKTETGEIPLNKYGEEKSASIVGIEHEGTIYVTRWHEWTIGKKPLISGSEKEWPEPLHLREPETWESIKYFTKHGPPPKAGAFERGGEPATPWSSVNNCTLVEVERRTALSCQPTRSRE